MNSLHNFEKSLDKFLAWLSEAESSLETVDSDIVVTAGAGASGRKDYASLKPNNQLKVSHKFILPTYRIVPRKREKWRKVRESANAAQKGTV